MWEAWPGGMQLIPALGGGGAGPSLTSLVLEHLGQQSILDQGQGTFVKVPGVMASGKAKQPTHLSAGPAN